MQNYFGSFWIDCFLLLIGSFVLQNENVNQEASSLQMLPTCQASESHGRDHGAYFKDIQI